MNETQVKPILQTPNDSDSIYGRCPVCNRELRPVNLATGQPHAPEPGKGKWSRAICKGCGSILEYFGNGKWKAVNPN